MTLVVARISKDTISIVSDTQITEHGHALPVDKGVIKSCILPGDLCAAFSNSPELARRDFEKYAKLYVEKGMSFGDTVNFFINASAQTGNDHLLAFGKLKKVVSIKEGVRNRLFLTSSG